MNFEYTISKIGAMGEAEEPYGQRWWGTAEGSDLEISFYTRSDVQVHAGSKITAEEKVIKMTKPKPDKPSREYVFLKKVKVVGGQMLSTSTNDYAPPSPTQPAQTMNPLDVGAIEGQLKRIEEKLDKLLGLDDPEQDHAQAQAKRDQEQINGGDELFPETEN